MFGSLVCFSFGACTQDSDLLSSVIEDSESSGGDDLLIDDPNKKGDFILDEIRSSNLKAFPTAEGAGANSKGGRGGKVLHVTTLEDGDYEGTFRWAVTREYPRIVVFDVSGTIYTDDYINIYSGNLTIAGQTAPKGGITIQGPRIGIYNTTDVIIRYLRLVNTNYFFDKSHSALAANGCRNIIIDHCSFRYTATSPAVGFQDNNFAGGQGEISFQKNLIGDCYTGILVGSVANDDSRIVLAGSNSVHHNLFVHVDHRFPNVSGNASAEIVNNVVYNYRNRLSSFFNNSKSNVVGNYYKSGPTSYASYGARFKIGDYLKGVSYVTPKLYIENNKMDDPWLSLKTGEDNWSKNVVVWDGSPASILKYKSNYPFESLGVPIKEVTPEQAYVDVINDVGANGSLNKYGQFEEYLDEVDIEFINDVINRECAGCEPDPDYPEYIKYRKKTDKTKLLYPVLPSYKRADNFDADRDGMPDVWESAMGLNVNVDDSFIDDDGDGYTNIEEYLNINDLNLE